MYHSRLTQLIAIKKGEQYAKTISWIRTRTSFALLRSALVCLRGSRTRRVLCDIINKNVDIDVEVVEGTSNRTIDVFPLILFFLYPMRFLNLWFRLLIGKLVRKINSNRFISCLMDQKVMRIIRTSALTFMSYTGTFDLIFLKLFVISGNFELRRGFAGILY